MPPGGVAAAKAHNESVGVERVAKGGVPRGVRPDPEPARDQVASPVGPVAARGSARSGLSSDVLARLALVAASASLVGDLVIAVTR
jgi:hypothetical protein